MSNEGRDGNGPPRTSQCDACEDGCSCEGCLVVMAEGDAMTTDKKEVDCVEFMAKHTTAHQG